MGWGGGTFLTKLGETTGTNGLKIIQCYHWTEPATLFRLKCKQADAGVFSSPLSQILDI